MKKLIFGVVLSFSATCYGGISKPSKAFLLSLFLPGGGQYYNGAIVKGLFASSAELLLGYGIYHYNKTMSDARLELDEGKFISERRKRNDCVWAFCGVVLLASIDAYVDAHLKGFELNIAYLPLANPMFCVNISKRLN